MTYYLHKDRVPKIKLNLFNLKLDCMKVKGQTKVSRKLGERTDRVRKTDKKKPECTYTHFPPRKPGAGVRSLRGSQGVWVVRASPPRLRKASTGEAESQSCGQRARVVRNTQDCRIPPLSLS